MSHTGDHCVLVPVAVLEGESIPRTVVDAFASIPVVLLGYYEVPEQTSPEQARDQYQRRAASELEERRSVFEDAGCPVTSRLVFTNDRFETFERVAVEAECDAVLLLNPAPVLERMLVAVRSDINAEYKARLVATVLAGTTIDVTLLHVVPDERDRERGDELLATMADALADAGVGAERVTRSVVVDDSPTEAILEASAAHDIAVVGESRPSVRRYIFRDRAERIAKRTADPVLVVRGEYLEADDNDDVLHDDAEARDETA